MRPRGAWPAIACLLCASAIDAQGDPAHERFVCKAGTSVRVISLYRDASGGAENASGCHVDYTREGSTKTLWSVSTKGYAYCVKKALSLVTTLSRGRYACTPDTVGKAAEEQ